MPGERLKKRLSSPRLVSGRLGWARLGPARAEPSRAQPSQAEPNPAKPSPTEPSRADPSRDKQTEPSRLLIVFRGFHWGSQRPPKDIFLTLSGQLNSLPPINQTRPYIYIYMKIQDVILYLIERIAYLRIALLNPAQGGLSKRC